MGKKQKRESVVPDSRNVRKTGQRVAKRRPTSYYIDFENVRGAGLTGVENLGKHDRVVVLYGSKDSALRISQVENVLASPAKVEFIKVSTGKSNALDFQLVAVLFMKMKKKRDYVIVSKDTGFDFAIGIAKRRGAYNVRRQQTISGELLEPKKLPQPKQAQAKRLPQPSQSQGEQGKQQPKAAQAGKEQPQAEQQPKQQAQKKPTKPQKPPKDPYRLAVERVLAKHLGGLPPAKRVEIVLTALDSCETKAKFYNYLRGNMGNEQGLAFYRDIKGCFEQLRAIEKEPAGPTSA